MSKDGNGGPIASTWYGFSKWTEVSICWGREEDEEEDEDANTVQKTNSISEFVTLYKSEIEKGRL